MGRKKEAHILSYGYGVPAVNAALCNGAMGHARDYDANHDIINYKSNVAVVPALLAVGELKEKTSGRDIITAMALGVDLGCRIGLASSPKPFHVTARSVGCFGAAIAVSKLLGANQKEIIDALGIVFTEVGIGGRTIKAPALTKRLGIGIAARAGVFANLLAQKGYRGPQEIFEGPENYYQLYTGREGDLLEITKDLGERSEIENVAIKPYPSCRYTHASIDAALSLKKENRLEPKDINNINVWVNPRDYEMVGGGRTKSIEKLRKPTGVVDAQFSIPYTVAVALCKNKVSLQYFNEGWLSEPDIIELAQKISVFPDEKLQFLDRDLHPIVLSIKTNGGKEYTKKIEHPKGGKEAPMTSEEIIMKFKDCLNYSAVSLKKRSVEQVLEMLLSLEEIEDIKDILTLLR